MSLIPLKKMKKINISGSQLAVSDQGSGDVVVFVHGFPFDHRMWQPVISRLSVQGFRCVAPDLRGFGQSDFTEGVVSIERFAEDIAAILESLRIEEPIILCGLSMGGYISLQFAKKFPKRLKTLVLCDTKTAADSPEAAENRRRTADSLPQDGLGPLVEGMIPKVLCEKTLKEKPQLLAALKEQMLSHHPLGVAAAARGMAERRDSSDILAALDCPVWVLCGDQDAISPPAEMQAMAETAKTSRFALIADSGHLAPLENPEQWTSEFLEFYGTL